MGRGGGSREVRGGDAAEAAETRQIATSGEYITAALSPRVPPRILCLLFAPLTVLIIVRRTDGYTGAGSGLLNTLLMPCPTTPDL